MPQCAGLHQKQDSLKLTVRTSSRVNSRTFLYTSPFEAYRWRTDTVPPVSEKRLLLYAQSDSIADLCCNNEVSFCPFTGYHHSLPIFNSRKQFSLTPTVKHLFTNLLLRNARADFRQVSLSLNNDETSYCCHR